MLYMSVILVHGKPREEELRFEASLGCVEGAYLSLKDKTQLGTGGAHL